ncbi:MAG: hypothetical protein ABL962_16290 [Fimbriimonadaceae bacterium]
MLQKLVNIRRAAGTQFKTDGFFAFTAEQLSVDVPVEPGAYIPAYQFVNAATGQVAGVLVLERLEV